MTNSSKYLFLFLLGLLLIGCSSTKDLPVKTAFNFEYDSHDYQIISINAPDGEGMNYLVSFENDSTTLRCLDKDQDGNIEVIQYGDFSLTDVNIIYHFGIRKALEAGKFKSRKGQRIYEVTESDSLFSIETLGNYTDQLYNRFIILDLKNNQENTFWDLDADGTLDQTATGETNIQIAQELYQRFIRSGIEESRIQLRNDKYIVQFTSTPPSS